jgi:hypothetical protein
VSRPKHHRERADVLTLNRREREVLQCVVQLHDEFGRDIQVTSKAVAHLLGPAAGSLAALTMAGYVRQRPGLQGQNEGMRYQATPAGFEMAARALATPIPKGIR